MPAEHIDQVHADAVAQYSNMMSRWKRDVLTTMGDTIFWRLVWVNRHIRAPLQHMTHFLKKELSEDEVKTHGRHLAQLVSGKAENIFREFEDVAAKVPC